MFAWLLFPFKFIYLSIRFLWLILSGRKDQLGIRLASMLKDLGPSYIKIGQILSVRPDIVGSEVAEALSHLQDKLPAEKFSKVKKTIERELKAPIDQLFAKFDDNAKNAASIAQVYKATLLSGEDVAVKVLRGSAVKSFYKDINFFYRITKIISLIPKLRRLKLVEVVETFEDTVKKELDLRIEAASASQLADNCKNDKEVKIPAIFWEYTSKSILCIEWINGTRINNSEELLKNNHDPKQVAEKLIITFLNQSYRDGFFHADLHPGNLFINNNGQITPIDFGIMGSLDYKTRIFVAEILRGFLIADYRHVAKIHFDAGYIPHNESLEDFALACRMIGEPIFQKSSNEVSVAKLLALLFKITEDFNMETQPQLLLLQKTLMTVEGVCAKIHPQINMWKTAQPWIENWAKENLGIKAQVKKTTNELAEVIQRLPYHIKKNEDIFHKITNEGIILHPETISKLSKLNSEPPMITKLSYMSTGGAIIAAIILLLTW